MVDLGMYECKDSNTGKIAPKEYFTSAYVEEVFELEHVRTSTKISHIILDAKYKKEDLNKAMKNKFQHLTEEQRNE